jgi:UDP-glucose:(heptosyl)LPS alpha-1,3-glucosyltransferase
MRIAVSHTRASDVGGVERYAHQLVVRLIEAGHEVHYFCHFWDDSVDRRIRFHRLPCRLKHIRCLKLWEFDVRSERAIERAGPFDLVVGFSKTSRQDIYRDGSGCYGDLMRYTGSAYSPLQRLLRHASLYPWMMRRIERRRYTPGNFLLIVANSGLVREQILRRYGLAPGDVEVVHNGVDTRRFTPELAAAARPEVRGELGIAAGAPLLLFVGSDFYRKGLGPFLRALALLPGDVQAVVVGRERARREAAYRELARRLGVAERVRFLGLRGDTNRLYAAADCLVVPTLFDAFANVALEGMAAGIPVVLSARAGTAEMMVPGETGAIVADPEDARALAAAIRPYILDPALRRAHGRRGREVAERYSWDWHFERLLALYEDVARRKAARGGAAGGATGGLELAAKAMPGAEGAR